jgi:hypothetical protein
VRTQLVDGFVGRIVTRCEVFTRVLVKHLTYLKNDPSYEFIGEVILKINIV